MIDFWSGTWQGFCTGVGVIVAARFIGWVDSHPFVGGVKEGMDIILLRRKKK